MKILQIVYSLAPGGAERFVVDLSNELSEKQQVILCVLRDDKINNQGFYKAEIKKNVSYINLNLEPGLQIKNIRILFNLIRTIKPNIIHCHQNLVNYIFPLTFLFPKIRFFHTIHTQPNREISNRLEYILRFFFYRTRLVKAITISDETSELFKLYYHTKKYIQIYNGRKNSELSNEFINVSNYFQTIRSKHKTIFIHVARFAPEKNQQMLIESFNELAKENDQIALIILGAGFNSEKGKVLQSTACRSIFFLGEKTNIFDYYCNADAFCLSSIQEGMPITLIEALSCGCIPICTPVGGIKNTIIDGVNGFLSETTNKKDFINALKRFMKLHSQINKNTLMNLFKEKFSIEKCAEVHTQNYKRK